MFVVYSCTATTIFIRRCYLWSMRIWSNITVLLMLAGCGYLIYYVAENSFKPDDQVPEFIGDFIKKYQLSLVVSGLKLFVPPVLFIILGFEHWHPRTEIKLQILRTAVFYGANLFVFLYSVYSISTECETDSKKANASYCCWENNLAEQVFQITVLDVMVNWGVAFVVIGVRAMLIKSFNFEKLGRPEFHVAGNLLDLLYLQALVWLGLFLAPFMAWFGLAVLLLTFYIHSFLVQTFCVPSNSVFQASRSGSFSRFILLVTLFFCVVPASYAIANFSPSASCGPFRHQSKIYTVLTERVGESPQWVKDILDYVTTPVVALPVFILIILIALYYKAKSTTHQMAANELLHHLQFERKVEKRRVLARANLHKGIRRPGRLEGPSRNNPLHQS